MGRNKLLAQGLAVYPSPENKQMFAEEIRVCITHEYDHLYYLYMLDINIQLLITATLFIYSVYGKEIQKRESKPGQDSW